MSNVDPKDQPTLDREAAEALKDTFRLGAQYPKTKRERLEMDVHDYRDPKPIDPEEE